MNQFQSLWDEGKTTIEHKLQGPQLISKGKDTELIAAVSERFATAGVALRGLPTLDALTADGCPTAGTTLVLDTRTLSEGQDIAITDGPCGAALGKPSHTGLYRPFRCNRATVAGLMGRRGRLLGRLRGRRRAGLPAARARRYPRPGRLPDSGSRRPANFTVRVLEEAGMHARSIGNPRRVLETLEALRPDLVLMDLHMPGVDGTELTALIREHEVIHAIPVVLLSSKLDPGRQLDTRYVRVRNSMIIKAFEKRDL